MMNDLKTSIADGLRTMAGSKIAWFLAGVFLGGTDIPAVIASLRTFVGV